MREKEADERKGTIEFEAERKRERVRERGGGERDERRHKNFEKIDFEGDRERKEKGKQFW